jgi:predicted RecB family endonuclease
MNEREQFLQTMQSFIAAYLERIQRMTEAQVVNALQMLQATRRNQEQTLAFLKSVSLNPTEESDHEIKELKSQLDSPERAGYSPFDLSDYIEDALKKRLETLRRRGK